MNSNTWKQIPLEGLGLTLLPLAQEHFEGHLRAALPHLAEIWKWYTVTIDSKEDFETFYSKLLVEQSQAQRMMWSVYRNQNMHEPLGVTGYFALAPEHKRVEIGSTWFYPEVQKTEVNVSTKLLLLDFAFGTLDCQRVELKTDSLNIKSRTAMEKCGATFEGIMKNHMTTDSGRTRHTAWYAFYDDEWQQKRKGLEARCAQKRSFAKGL